jgi:tetratricopeptide (TPR) repeat protein
MWRQPDSALAQLQAFCNSPEADSLDEFNGHYCQLLISELLYKNDWGQSNREELLQAVAYFDSLVRLTPPLQRGLGGLKNTPTNQNDNLVFLAARAHYINGAGYYEKDSVVNACAEYLKALEVMEEHFEEKERVGNMAKFMALTHGRLGEMFEEQLLAEPAIACYKQALFYCRREPTSKYGIPVLLYHLGIQYDIVDQKDSAAFYYDEALANMPDFDNLHYRDLMSNKAIFAFYNLDYSSDSVINILKHLVTLSADEEERTTRLLTLGHILFEDKQYDSSRVYLETVFEQQEDITSKMIAAERLSSIYQMEGDSIKAQKYASFLVGLTMSEIEKKTEASKENEMFKDYLAQKQKKQAVIEREKAVKRALLIIIPIAAVVALVVFIDAKRRNKKQLKEQQAEAKKLLEEKDKQHAEVLEAERQTHRMEQAAIAGRLKRSNQELRELKGQIKHLDDLAAKTEAAASFNEEPICRLIMERVNEGQFKAKIDCELYKSYALDKQQLLDLRVAADLHFSKLTLRLRKTYPKLTNIDIDYCCLYLLNLTHADVSALMQRAYNTVVERDSKIQKILGSEKPLPVILMDIAHNPSST